MKEKMTKSMKYVYSNYPRITIWLGVLVALLIAFAAVSKFTSNEDAKKGLGGAFTGILLLGLIGLYLWAKKNRNKDPLADMVMFILKLRTARATRKPVTV